MGDAGKGVKAVYTAMQKAGLMQAELHLYPGARHDLMHEEAGAADAARTQLLAWLNSHL